MWISRQGMSRDGRQEAARVGVVSLPGDPAAVLLDGERRQVPVFAPGGYQWQPMRGERVLVVKAGPDGEQPCAAGVRGQRAWTLAPGEVVLYSGGGAASIRIRNDGVISMSGTVLVNGLPVMVEGG